MEQHFLEGCATSIANHLSQACHRAKIQKALECKMVYQYGARKDQNGGFGDLRANQNRVNSEEGKSVVSLSVLDLSMIEIRKLYSQRSYHVPAKEPRLCWHSTLREKRGMYG